MDWFRMINGWYNSEPKRWTIGMVKDAVMAGKITEEEFFTITGEVYVPKIEGEV